MDNIKDIIGHTFGLGFIKELKISTDSDFKTTIGAMAEDRSVVIYGSLKKPIEEIDTTVGFQNISVLNGYLKYPPFNEDDAVVSVSRELRGGVDVPSEIKFSSGNGHEASYRFMGPTAVENIRIPRFKGAEWNLTFSPTLQNLKDLQYFNGVLGGFESVFVPVVENGNLQFDIGSGAMHRSSIHIQDNVEGTFNGKWSFPLSEVLSVLKLSENSDCTMSFSENGVLKIEVDSGLGQYEYMIPARAT